MSDVWVLLAMQRVIASLEGTQELGKDLRMAEEGILKAPRRSVVICGNHGLALIPELRRRLDEFIWRAAGCHIK